VTMPMATKATTATTPAAIVTRRLMIRKLSGRPRTVWGRRSRRSAHGAGTAD
jgi:hypothetical protein